MVFLNGGKKDIASYFQIVRLNILETFIENLHASPCISFYRTNKYKKRYIDRSMIDNIVVVIVRRIIAVNASQD